MADLSLNMNPNALVLHARDAGRISRLEQAIKENTLGPKRKKSLEKEVSRVSPRPKVDSSPFSGSMNQRPDRALYTQLGKLIGATSAGLLALTATVWVAIQGAEALSRWPSVGVTFGILGGVYMGFVIVPAAVAGGFVAGWLAGYAVWSLRKLVGHLT